MLLSPRSKSLLIILMSLLIGFAGGFLVSGRLASQRFQAIKTRMADKERFVSYLLDTVLELEAKPEKQAIVRPIIEDHFVQMDSINRSFRMSMQEEVQVLRQALSSHLTAEQLEKLGHHLRMRKKKRRKPGPGGPPSPPPHRP